MTELVVGIYFHTSDAVLIEEFHIIAGIAVEEVVCTYTEPEQAYLAVRLSGITVEVNEL